MSQHFYCLNSALLLTCRHLIATFKEIDPSLGRNVYPIKMLFNGLGLSNDFIFDFSMQLNEKIIFLK